MTPQQAMKRAIQICGGKSALAKRLGITSQAISQWKKAPAGRVVEISRVSEWRVKPKELRPDIFEDEPQPHKRLRKGA